MKKARAEVRRPSATTCEIDISGSKHECRLENISSSGALVNCLGFLQETWPGDTCILHLDSKTGGISCQVTHISSSKVGLQFIDVDE